MSTLAERHAVNINHGWKQVNKAIILKLVANVQMFYIYFY